MDKENLPGHAVRPLWMITTIPAVAFLCVYVFLLLCIPSQLIIRQIGAPGTPANLWAILGFLWWLVATLGGQNPVRGWTPTRVTFGALTVAVLSSYAVGTAYGWWAPANVHQQTDELWTLVMVHPGEVGAKMVSAVDRGLLSFTGWAGVVLLTSEGLRSWADLDTLCKWLTRFAAFVATLGIIQFFTGFNIAGLFDIPGLSANAEFGGVSGRSVLFRVSSTAVHPIEFGVVMAGTFLLALHRSLYAKGRSLLTWIPTVLIAIALPMSVSRSAILAAAVSTIVVFIGWPPSRRWAAIAIAPFALVAMRLLAPGLLGTLSSLFSNLVSDPSITGRTSDYSAILGLYSEHPFFGRGLFSFLPRYYRIIDNQYLGSLIELGAFGLAALLVFMTTGVLAALVARSQTSDPRDRHLALVLSASIIGLCVSFSTFDALSFPMVAGLTFVLLGMSGTAWQLSGRRSNTNVRDLRRTLPQ